MGMGIGGNGGCGGSCCECGVKNGRGEVGNLKLGGVNRRREDGLWNGGRIGER